ncbi:MAG: hypothetical protein F4Y87_03910 [Synechococcus sp. SB0665_bin_28]|uniref:Uncharacterized protein n=1 Tax=Synechococcus sp. SB0676_bin_10 TaxID=2604869 RepID=A0A6B1F6V2_9SYNE|nr:hypothetical protein [Synechococcus sp. SB0667_bin_8]MXY19121.1 hypothetical protein [Synechococcus sp. SB0664_bin_36]MXY62577.1 hypothetical protein [Synechococcus sp. SB0665_bin_28]MYF20796.1 hypothetical protein [Synechococcus sp. SB0677_bin_5]MYG37907.1 hypothetical protein [Synechococcus sp. SB0676_bin_10]MYK07706.1 hypothetical protein [Synechococcus sp. SB0670_bin_20]
MRFLDLLDGYGGSQGLVDPPLDTDRDHLKSHPEPVREESQEPQPWTPHPMDLSPAPAGAPQKQERDYLVIGLIIA